MDNNLLSMDDLADVFEQLESIPDKEVPLTEEEIASQRRYDEIIKKHKEGQVYSCTGFFICFTSCT